MPLVARPRAHHYLASISILIITFYLLYSDSGPHHAYTVGQGGGRNNTPALSSSLKQTYRPTTPPTTHAGRLLALTRLRLTGGRSKGLKDVDLSGLRVKSPLLTEPAEEGKRWGVKEFATRIKGMGSGLRRTGVKHEGTSGPKRLDRHRAAAVAMRTKEDADRAFCGLSPCKVVVPSFLSSSEESTAQSQLTQLAQLASVLDRRLVLPNVQKSHIGMCGAVVESESAEAGEGRSWETYYDVGAFGAGAGLGQDKFERWLLTRPDPPRVQRIIIASHPSSTASSTPAAGFIGLSSSSDHPSHGREQNCLLSRARGNVRFGGWEDALILPELPSSPEWVEEGGLRAQVISMLSNSSSFEIFDPEYPMPVGTTPDILLVSYLSPDPIFATSGPSSPSTLATPFTSPDSNVIPTSPPGRVALPPPGGLTLPLAYAPGLVSLARRISGPLSPFVAVHWRTEGVEPSRMGSCARALIGRLDGMMGKEGKGKGVKTVYLVTDLPLQADGLFKSSAYRPPTENGADHEDDEDREARDEAVKLVKIAFGRWGRMGRRGVRLTGLREEMWVRGVGEKEKSLAGMDSGVAGILDKLIASHADLFLAPDEPCGISNSFTDQIVALRNRNLVLSSLLAEEEGDNGVDDEPSRLRNLVDHFGGVISEETELDPSEMTELQWILD